MRKITRGARLEFREWRRSSDAALRRVCVLEEIYSGTRKASRRGAVLRYVETRGMRKYTRPDAGLYRNHRCPPSF